MPTVSQTVETEVDVEIDFDLSDYESEIESEYCNGNCLKFDWRNIKTDLENYVKEMEKNLYFYADKHKKFKSYEEIYRDLDRIIKEN